MKDDDDARTEATARVLEKYGLQDIHAGLVLYGFNETTQRYDRIRLNDDGTARILCPKCGGQDLRTFDNLSRPSDRADRENDEARKIVADAYQHMDLNLESGDFLQALRNLCFMAGRMHQRDKEQVRKVLDDAFNGSEDK